MKKSVVKPLLLKGENGIDASSEFELIGSKFVFASKKLGEAIARNGALAEPTVTEIEALKRPRSIPISSMIVTSAKSGEKAQANIRFPLSVLGLIRGPDDKLITKSISLLKSKKKKGCSIGSRNKAPQQVSTVSREEVLSVFCLNTPQSPDPKGK